MLHPVHSFIIPIFSLLHPAQLFPGGLPWGVCHDVLHVQTSQAFVISQVTEVVLGGPYAVSALGFRLATSE